MKADRHEHLQRLPLVWVTDPIYFITTCTERRRPVLANREVADILISEWQSAAERHGWFIGRYVIMPDHVHFFARHTEETRGLSLFMNKWKEWTSKRVKRIQPAFQPLWQDEFFDHLLRNPASYESKWEYVRCNPVRAGLAGEVGAWPFQGEIHVLT